METYIKFIKNTFQANLAYRMDVLLRLGGRLVELLVTVSFWSALFWGGERTHTGTGTISLRDMITYAVVSAGISVFINNNAIGKINGKIRTGEIAMDLIKPVKFKGMILSDILGENLFRLLFEFIPMIILGTLLFGINFPIQQNLILFIIMLINGFIINFLFNYILGMICFWYLSVWHLRALSGYLITLFSGAFIPLWFFPGILKDISMVLPFRLIYFTPISVYIGKVTYLESFRLLGYQVAWIAVLILIEKLVWRKGVTKLVVQGG